MATLVPFNESNISTFSFQPTLDGTTYSANIVYNNYAQRWYLSIYTFGGVLELFTPLTASPDVVLQGAVCTANSNAIRITNRDSSLYAGMLVTGVNIPSNTYVKGIYGSLIILTQNAIASTPSGRTTTLTFTYSINLTKGYFATPIVYRASSNNIEIG
jgi:hypothetical protein